MLGGKVISRVEVSILVEVPPSNEVVMVYGYEVVIVEAAKTEVVVTSKTVVSLDKVTGYELRMVEAGWTDVSTRVKVSCASVEITVS